MYDYDGKSSEKNPNQSSVENASDEWVRSVRLRSHDASALHALAGAPPGAVACCAERLWL